MVQSTLEPIREISPEEAYRVFDSAAQYFLQMSGEDFVAAWKAGAFKNADETPGVLEVASLAPGLLGR
jgi:hypothetical protein